MIGSHVADQIKPNSIERCPPLAACCALEQFDQLPAVAATAGPNSIGKGSSDTGFDSSAQPTRNRESATLYFSKSNSSHDGARAPPEFPRSRTPNSRKSSYYSIDGAQTHQRYYSRSSASVRTNFSDSIRLVSLNSPNSLASGNATRLECG